MIDQIYRHLHNLIFGEQSPGDSSKDTEDKIYGSILLKYINIYKLDFQEKNLNLDQDSNHGCPGLYPDALNH